MASPIQLSHVFKLFIDKAYELMYHSQTHTHKYLSLVVLFPGSFSVSSAFFFCLKHLFWITITQKRKKNQDYLNLANNKLTHPTVATTSNPESSKERKWGYNFGLPGAKCFPVRQCTSLYTITFKLTYHFIQILYNTVKESTWKPRHPRIKKTCHGSDQVQFYRSFYCRPPALLPYGNQSQAHSYHLMYISDFQTQGLKPKCILFFKESEKW